jgi:hypothetical protein
VHVALRKAFNEGEGVEVCLSASYLLESVILASVTLQLTYLDYLRITLLSCASQILRISSL